MGRPRCAVRMPICGGRFLAVVVSHLLILPSEGQAVRVVPCTFVFACLLASFSGCQLFEKKSSGSSDTPSPFLGDKTADKGRSGKPADPLIGGAGGISDVDSILTGKVIDGTGGPADAVVRCVCTDDAKEEDAPISVAVNSQGYFTIQGLKTGKRYKLTTRAQSGDKTLEVVTLTQVPNIHLLIQVSERFAVPASPDKGKGKKPNIIEQPPTKPNPGLPVRSWFHRHRPTGKGRGLRTNPASPCSRPRWTCQAGRGPSESPRRRWNPLTMGRLPRHFHCWWATGWRTSPCSISNCIPGNCGRNAAPSWCCSIFGKQIVRRVCKRSPNSGSCTNSTARRNCK